MIREVKLDDCKAIAEIYNEYVLHSTITFETEPVTNETMQDRIQKLSEKYPYYVYEEKGDIIGYCYAHDWKQKAAYKHTLETTIYLSPNNKGKGIGTLLMQYLIEQCKQRGYHSLIACITEGNEASNHLHLKLGFEQVSHFREVGMKFDKWLDVVDYELLLK